MYKAIKTNASTLVPEVIDVDFLIRTSKDGYIESIEWKDSK